MFANRYTALIDANVLVSAPKRDLIFTLAQAEMYRFRWSERILKETEAALALVFNKHGKPNAEDRAKASCGGMRSLFPEAMIDADFSATPAYPGLPDANDHHVVHAAILCKASMIVTENLADFPSEALQPFELEAKSADSFIADAIDLDQIRTAEAVKQLRTRLRNPAYSAEELLDTWEQRHGLTETVALLRPYQGLI
ncbi:PIN domain-containing protein [Hyphomonas sp.]|uniref:PIN domain-containing protein n=1 Tax=Hyphomonas sp. TaxID=87 RepID=UPI0025C67AEF|nr:PIN domain-containing protein [Hyphomonas sp.]